MTDALAHAPLREAVLLLGFALACVLLFRKLGLGATLGYLLAGALVGPHVLGWVGDAGDKIDFAELGIAFLLFVVGLELNPSQLWRMKGEIFGLGLLQVVISGIAIVAIMTLSLDTPLAITLALGLPLALSSTAQVLPMLQSAGRLKTPFGQRAFAILLFQDLSIIPLITLVAVMSGGPEASRPGWQLALITVGAIVGLILAGRYLIRPLFGLISNQGERELFVVAALFTIIASAAVMELLGLSIALGAFVAGVMLADSPYRHELEADVEPFRSILLGLFFLAVGMMLDLGAIAARPFFVISMAAALIVAKTAILFLIGIIFRMNWRSALALGLLLSQGGEFGFVLFAQARDSGLVDAETASLFGAIVTLSMVTTPFLMMVTSRIRRQPVPMQVRDGPRADGASAIVVGYGRFGQTVTQMLMAGGVSVTTIDIDADRIDRSSRFGAKVYFGDGTRIDLLRQAGAADAQLIMFCQDGDTLTTDLIAAVHAAFPQASIHVRAYDRISLIRLRESPAAQMVREVMESAIALARGGLDGLGLGLDDIERAERHYRANDSERLHAQFDSGDVQSGRDRIIIRPDLGQTSEEAG
jgi:CPA2 family monovalent cation:H+ antiporter-2/glutathione-regulated potassium-efflux system protein KefB